MDGAAFALCTSPRTVTNLAVGDHTFEVRADQLTPGKRYVRLQVKETAGSATIVSVVAFGDEGNHKPNNANNNTTAVVTQNVVA